MKSPKSLRRDTYKQVLTKLLEQNPEAHKVTNRYKVMSYVLDKEWSNSMKNGFMDIKDFLQDVVYVDRLIRLRTEGDDNEEKRILSEEFQLEVLSKM